MYLNCTAYTPVGKFTGTITKESESEENLIKARDTLETIDLNYVVLFKGAGEEVLLSGTILANSVLVFTIDEKPYK